MSVKPLHQSHIPSTTLIEKPHDLKSALTKFAQIRGEFGATVIHPNGQSVVVSLKVRKSEFNRSARFIYSNQQLREQITNHFKQWLGSDGVIIEASQLTYAQPIPYFSITIHLDPDVVNGSTLFSIEDILYFRFPQPPASIFREIRY